MSERRRFLRREDALLVFWCFALGFAGAAVFAVYRAVSLSGEDVSGRLAEFGTNLLWPGVLIFGAVAVTIFFGWKANLD